MTEQSTDYQPELPDPDVPIDVEASEVLTPVPVEETPDQIILLPDVPIVTAPALPSDMLVLPPAMPEMPREIVHLGRRFWFGLFWLLLGQWIFTRRDPLLVNWIFASEFNKNFRIDVPNIDNVGLGLICLLIGVFILWKPIQAMIVPDPRELPAPVRRPLPLWRAILRYSVVLGVVSGLFVVGMRQLSLKDTSSMILWIWLLMMLVIAYVLFVYDRAAKIPLGLGIRRADLLMLLIVLVVGFAVGSYRLTSIPSTLIGDEAGFWERAFNMGFNGAPTFFFDFGVYAYPLPSSIFQMMVLQVFGPTFWSWRFSSVIPAVLAAIPTYFLARDMVDRRVGFVSALLMVTLPHFLAFERMGYNNSQAILPVAACMWLLYVGYTRKSAFYLALGGFAGGLGFYTYTAGRLGLVIAAAFMGLVILGMMLGILYKRGTAARLAQVRLTGQWIGMALTFGFCGVIAILPGILYQNAVNPTALRMKTLESLFPNVMYAASIYAEGDLYKEQPAIKLDDFNYFYRPDLYRALIVRGITRTMLANHSWLGLSDSHFIEGPLAGALSVIFYTIGFFLVLLRVFRNRGMLLLQIWYWLALLLLSMVHTFPPRYQHTIPVIPVICIMAGIGLVMSVDLMQRVFRFSSRLQLANRLPPGQVRRVGLLAPVFFTGLVVGVVIFANLDQYFVKMPREDAYLPDWENVMAFHAVNLTEPENMVYFTADAARAAYVPWIITNLPNKANFKTVLLSDLTSGGFKLDSTQKYTLYFSHDIAPVVVRWITDTFKLMPEQIHIDAERASDGHSLIDWWVYDPQKTVPLVQN